MWAEEENTKAVGIMNQEKFNEMIEKLQVLSRSNPEDKFILTLGLQMQQKVVAVTGDGINDAPALR